MKALLMFGLLVSTVAAADECGQAAFAARVRADFGAPVRLKTHLPVGTLPSVGRARRVEKSGAVLTLDGKPFKAPSESVLYVEVATTWPTQKLVEALTPLAASHELRLLVTGLLMTSPARTDAPIPEADRNVLINVNASDRATIAASHLFTELEGCPASKKLEGSVAKAAPPSKLKTLVEGVASAVASCPCAKVKLPSVEAWLAEVVNDWNAPLGWMPLDLAEAAGRASVGDIARATDRD